MNIVKATAKYEEWLAQFIPIVGDDLDFKRQQMRSSEFAFLRATFYRWAQLFADDSATIGAPPLLAVGDLHVENYGTWRDAEGRMIWGINDFDEAAMMPYTNDLVRLATSIILADATGGLKLDIRSACESLLEGYLSALESQGKPYVLEAEHGWLRRLATGVERQPDRFWNRLASTPLLQSKPQSDGLEALNKSLPTPIKADQIQARRAGLGSLGHPRYLAIINFDGGNLAREAKLLAPSAVLWVAMETGGIDTRSLIEKAVRCHDPMLKFHGPWAVRRLAPSCSRIELAMLPAEREEEKLVNAMGFELGNVHLANPNKIPAVLAHLSEQPKKWLRKAAERMADLVAHDFAAYRKGT